VEITDSTPKLKAVTHRNTVKGAFTAIRSKDWGVCTHTVCLICSFMACMVTAGTGKNTRINYIEVDGKSIKATFELL
jgi:hypothetical protein